MSRSLLTYSFLTAFWLAVFAPQAGAAFPFNIGKAKLTTDYSKTVWDQIMAEQAVGDMRRGLMEMTLQKHSAAANSFARAVVKNPQDPMAHFLYGAALYWTGRVDDALSEYREGLRLDPQNAMGYQLTGIAWGWKGDIAQATQAFETAARLDPNKADTQMNLGSAYAAQHQYEKALDHYRRAVDLSPRYALYHYELGTLYDFLGRDAQAEASYKKALHFFRGYEDAQLALGVLYEKQGRSDAALNYYKKAVRSKPGDFVARLRYGHLLLRLGQTQAARQTLEEAFLITRFHADGLALNAVYRMSGQNAQAFKDQLEKFKNNLLKVPPTKDVQVEAELDLQPSSPPNTPSAQTGGRFTEAYQSLRASGNTAQPGQSTMRMTRQFTLSATDDAQREKQVQELIEQLEQSVTAAAKTHQVSMRLQGRTMDYTSPSALTQDRTAPPRAVYDPRIVGNDMGLWVMGRDWLRYAQETQEELQENALPDEDLSAVLRGLAALVLGDGPGAAQAFAQAHTFAPQDVLPLLGLGTAAIIAGQDEEASSYYRAALQVDPANKTAKRNLAVLEE